MSNLKTWLKRVPGIVPAGQNGQGSGDLNLTTFGEDAEDQARRVLEEVEGAEIARDPYGLHEITKKLDKWFAIEVWRLEQQARKDAHEWALAGLPRAGVSDDDLPVERALAARASEILRKSTRMVRTKVQDGIASATRRVGSALNQYRENISALNRTLKSIERTKEDISHLNAEPDGTGTTIGFTHVLGHKKFWGLIALLICVDWIANVPVFQELLPKEPGANALWENVVARSERWGVLSGLYRSAMRVVFAPEVSLLALGVIAFLVFLAHVSGDSLRNLLAIADEDLPDARLGIRAHRRQYLVPAVVGLIGAICVVFVLYLAREELHRQTRERLIEAEQHVQLLQDDLAAATDIGDLNAIGEINQQLPAAQATVESRRTRAEYAAGIQSMNAPITILNMVLLIAAAIASYLAASNTLTERRLVNPKRFHLEKQLNALEAQVEGHREAIRKDAIEVQNELSQAARLLHSRPLTGWNEKADRLRAVINLFRSENAKERGIDPATILAFKNTPALDVSDVDHEDPFEAPAELTEYAEEFRRLRQELSSIDGRQFARSGGDGR